MYKVKNSGPNAEPCCTPYASVTLSQRVILIFMDLYLWFVNEKQNQIWACPDIPYQSESLYINVAWSMVPKAADQSSSVRAVTSSLSIVICKFCCQCNQNFLK